MVRFLNISKIKIKLIIDIQLLNEYEQILTPTPKNRKSQIGYHHGTKKKRKPEKLINFLMVLKLKSFFLLLWFSLSSSWSCEQKKKWKEIFTKRLKFTSNKH